MCELDETNTPMCVCQDPTSCPTADGEFEHVSLKFFTVQVKVSSANLDEVLKVEAVALHVKGRAHLNHLSTYFSSGLRHRQQDLRYLLPLLCHQVHPGGNQEGSQAAP